MALALISAWCVHYSQRTLHQELLQMQNPIEYLNVIELALLVQVTMTLIDKSNYPKLHDIFPCSLSNCTVNTDSNAYDI
jgi:hypothetical protein